VREQAVDDHAACFRRAETERLAAAGLLNERLMVMHAGALTDDDIAAFAHRRVMLNHNPVGNALFGFGSTGSDTVRRALHAGVQVALGTDWSQAVTPPGELIRAAMMLQRDYAADDTAFAAHEALAASIAAASYLVPDGASAGRVEIGYTADLVVTDVAALHHLDQPHPVPALTWHARPDDVRIVIVDGRVRVRNGHRRRRSAVPAARRPPRTFVELSEANAKPKTGRLWDA
jgi:5-methylthioadenosine/S-adenosylhomocysteine deaminase